MFAIKLFFCFVTAFAIFTGADSFYTPADGIKFTCVEVCYGHLRGKTYSCDMYSPQGTVTIIVRMIMDLNWRFYVIPKILPESRFCKRVADADHYYMSGKASCSSSSYPFRSIFKDTHRIDSSKLQSNLRLEEITRLLSLINNGTTEVLNDLKGTSSNKGLRFNQPKILYPMKVEIKILIEKLVDHLSLAAMLNDDINYHQPSDNSGVYTVPPSLPNFLNRPGPLPRNIAKYKSNKVPTNSHTLNYTEHNTQNVKNHNHHNAVYDSTNYYDHPVDYETSNTYNIDSNNDQFSTFNDGRKYGINLHFKKRGKRAEDLPKVNEVKELASKLKEESSELLKDLEDGSLAKNPEKETRKFGFLTKLLSGLMKLINHNNWYEDDMYRRAEGIIGTQRSERSKNYPRDNSRSVGDSNKMKFTHDTFDKQGECPLCTRILHDICNDGRIVVCNENKCCWRRLNQYPCMVTMNDSRAIACYNSLFNILQWAKM